MARKKVNRPRDKRGETLHTNTESVLFRLMGDDGAYIEALKKYTGTGATQVIRMALRDSARVKGIVIEGPGP